MFLRRQAAEINLGLDRENMRLWTICVLWLTLMAAQRESWGQHAGSPRQIIENVRVVDVVAGKASAPQRVLIDGARIVAVGAVELPADGDVVRIDAEGRYLIPGLFDAHVHLVPDADHFAPLLVAHGVTSVRDLGGPTELILALKRSAADSSTPIPDITATGSIIDGTPPVWPFSEPCASSDEARAAVQRLAAAGVDQIKVYSLLAPDAYRAAVAEAQRLGLPVTGHVPYSIRLEETLHAGQNCIEHLEGFGPLLTELAPVIDEEPARNPMIAAFRGWSRWREVDRDRLQAVVLQNAVHRVTHCPTLVVMDSISRITDPNRNPNEDARLKYVSPAMLAFWDSGRYIDFSPRARQALPAMKALVGELHRAGVNLVVGTDLANPFVFAGSAVHDEMQHFVEAGIPPADVLRMATINAAQLCGVADQRGSIAVGKTASLVLLDANPLSNIEAVRHIRAVWLRGKYYDRAALDALLAEVEQSVRGATVPETQAGPQPDIPGRVVLRGQYQMKFGQLDAGVEDFVVTESEDGLRVWAHQQPKGGGQIPAITTVHFGSDGTFVEATWETQDRRQLRAQYRRDAGALVGEAKLPDQALGESRLALTEPYLISTPVYASEFGFYGPLQLAPGESIELHSTGFGYPDWKPAAAPMTITRLADEALDLDGRRWSARVYHSVLKTNMGEMNIKTWTGPDGHTLQSELRFPFGTVTATRRLIEE